VTRPSGRSPLGATVTLAASVEPPQSDLASLVVDFCASVQRPTSPLLCALVVVVLRVACQWAPYVATVTSPQLLRAEAVVWTSLGPLPRWVPGPTTRWAPGTTRLALHDI
jgi:hypothetical protein